MGNRSTGKITSEVTVGSTYVIISAMVFFSLLGGLIWFPFFYSRSEISTEELNSWYLYLDSGVGGAFGLLFTDMFEKVKPPE